MSDDAPDWADDTEQQLLDAALPLAVRLGWNSTLVAAAGKAVGLSAGETMLLLPNGARDLAALLFQRHDRATARSLAHIDPQALKIRERIRRGAEARMDAAAAHSDASRRCAAFLALPQNAALGLRLAWESADGLWRWAGDTATDENHYSKRAILAAILISATALRLSAGREASRAFLNARIDNVMAFEKWKATRKPTTFGRDLAERLGRWRYGVQPDRPTAE